MSTELSSVGGQSGTEPNTVGFCVQMCMLAFEADMEKAFAAQLSQGKVGVVRV